jgi:hypothetical protein
MEVRFVMGKGQEIQAVLRAVIELPEEWHAAGTFHQKGLEKLVEHAGGLDIQYSVETGTGKTTLLFSHLSGHHTVFAKDDSGDGDSLQVVRECPILQRAKVEFVVGPTQRTLPNYEFKNKLQLVLIDGPHAYPFAELEYYYLYPQVCAGGLLVLDDIHIPTIFNMFRFLREDRMFELVEVVKTTAFFKRTSEHPLDPFGDGWWLQEYNKRRFPIHDGVMGYSMYDRMKYRVPQPVRTFVKKALGIAGDPKR